MLEFFDTETVDGKTVLMTSSNDYVWNSKGLSWNDCFDFLLKNSKKYNYFYRIDYDVNMILRDLNKEKIIEIFSGKKIKIDKYEIQYEIQYYKDKIFVLNGKKFYDIANFFNTSLMNVIDILKIDLNEEEKKFVDYMKKRRSEFVLNDKNKIIEYSILENKIGIKIVEKIYNLIPNDYKTYCLYGASAITNKFLEKHKIKTNYLFNSEIFRKAFFGGRMEALKIGTFKNVYKYDINSAYPNVIQNLREPVYYSVLNYDGEPIKNENIYEVKFSHPKYNMIGTLPIRLRNGYLVFPKEGKGWYYGIEVKEAMRRGVEIEIGKVINVKLGRKIFGDEIKKMYDMRKEYKRRKDLKHYIYKIILNSIYGKFAQSVGRAQYRNLYLAGFITASVRAKLLEVTRGYDDEIIFFATDGILTKRKLSVPISDNIGEFEMIPIKEAVVIMSGVYRLIGKDGKEYVGERGFVLNMNECIQSIKKQGYYDVIMKVFISNIYALKNHKKYGKDRCKFVNVVKRIDIRQQHKRIFESFDLTRENNSILLNRINLEKINKLPELDFTEFCFDDFDIL